MKKFSEKELTIKPKCIIIGTNFYLILFNYYNKLYLDTLFKIKNILTHQMKFFFPHPREEKVYLKKLEKIYLVILILKCISKCGRKLYLSKNLELVIGTFSSALLYAKTIFNINHVYYIENFNVSAQVLIVIKIYPIFHSLNIKNFFNKN